MELFILFLLFGLVLILLLWQVSNVISIWLGAPAITSPTNELWLEFADPHKTILDLGCGSGSMCIAFAPHFKHVYGIEYSPFYFLLSTFRTRHLPNVTIIRTNFLLGRWPSVDIIYCYLMTTLLDRLRPRLVGAGACVLSYGFPIPGLVPSRTINKGSGELLVYRENKPLKGLAGLAKAPK